MAWIADWASMCIYLQVQNVHISVQYAIRSSRLLFLYVDQLISITKCTKIWHKNLYVQLAIQVNQESTCIYSPTWSHWRAVEKNKTISCVVWKIFFLKTFTWRLASFLRCYCCWHWCWFGYFTLARPSLKQIKPVYNNFIQLAQVEPACASLTRLHYLSQLAQVEPACISWTSIHQLSQLASVEPVCISWTSLHQLNQLAPVEPACTSWTSLLQLNQFALVEPACTSWTSLHKLNQLAPV